MSQSRAYLYDSFDKYMSVGMAARERGDIIEARKNLLKAAESLKRLADISEGEQKKAHLKRVRRLIDAVEELGSEQSAVSAENGVSSSAAPNEKITFDDIIGLESAKQSLKRILINPLKNPEVYKKYKLRPGGNILLEGPPGTGKTTFAKAAANMLAVPFIPVDTNSLVDSYIGKTGKNIDKMFASARALIKKNGCPAVLFLDEFDAIAGRRGGDSKTADEAVPTLIRQMDGFDTDNSSLVILASTNLKENIDPAVLSRFRNSINVPLPSEPERQKLMELKLRGKISARDFAALDLERAAENSRGFSGRDLNWIAEEIKNLLAERDAGLLTEPLDINAELQRLVLERAV
ncbi:MAG: ATP-binding protein [Clostridia bacterium]|nr:ATP-binding protein [Clostridia bacterium]